MSQNLKKNSLLTWKPMQLLKYGAYMLKFSYGSSQNDLNVNMNLNMIHFLTLGMRRAVISAVS